MKLLAVSGMMALSFVAGAGLQRLDGGTRTTLRVAQAPPEKETVYQGPLLEAPQSCKGPGLRKFEAARGFNLYHLPPDELTAFCKYPGLFVTYDVTSQADRAEIQMLARGIILLEERSSPVLEYLSGKNAVVELSHDQGQGSCLRLADVNASRARMSPCSFRFADGVAKSAAASLVAYAMTSAIGDSKVPLPPEAVKRLGYVAGMRALGVKPTESLMPQIESYRDLLKASEEIKAVLGGLPTFFGETAASDYFDLIVPPG